MPARGFDSVGDLTGRLTVGVEMISRSVKVIAVLADHWLVGNLANTGVRVLDLLDDSLDSYLTLDDVMVVPKTEPDRPVASLSDAALPKHELSMLIIPTRTHEVSGIDRLHKSVRKNPSKAFALIGDYAVEGTVQLMNPHDTSTMAFSRELGEFFPIVDATIGGIGMRRLVVPVILVNKSRVTCFHSGDQPEAVAQTL